MRGFVLGDSKDHTLSHSAVCDPLLCPWAQNLTRRKARHLAATSMKSIPPSSAWRCKVDRGTLKIASRHMYQDIAVKSCSTCSIGVGKIRAVCHILESRKVCTYWILHFRHRSRPYASLARAVTFPFVLDQVTFPERATALVNLKPSPDNMGCPACPPMCPTSLPPQLWILRCSNEHPLPFLKVSRRSPIT